MKIVVSSEGADLDAPTSPLFGRCQSYILVDPETMEFEAFPNPAIAAASGAGIQAAQFVIELGAQAVLTANVGPNAFDFFRAGDVPVFQVQPGTVRQAIEAYKSGLLQPLSGPNVAANDSQGMGQGLGAGQGQGMGQGLGAGQGQGMGQGLGAGQGQGMGQGLGAGQGQGMGQGLGAGRGRGMGHRHGRGRR